MTIKCKCPNCGSTDLRFSELVAVEYRVLGFERDAETGLPAPSVFSEQGGEVMWECTEPMNGYPYRCGDCDDLTEAGSLIVEDV